MEVVVSFKPNGLLWSRYELKRKLQFHSKPKGSCIYIVSSDVIGGVQFHKELLGCSS